MIILKSEEQIERMRQAGRIAGNARTLAGEKIRPGMTTGELDEIIKTYILKQGAKPSFYRYNGFPGNACISINEEIVHGIPGDRVIQEGDIVSVDVGAYYKGYHGDTAESFIAGEGSQAAKDLIAITRQSFYDALKFCYPGKRLGDIGYAVQATVEAKGYSTVRSMCGHGIGKSLHESPDVPNFGKPDTGDILQAGMVLAIEPMINIGTHRLVILDDDWTAVTQDGSLSAHYEHTVAITEDEPILLTQSDTERA